MRAYRSRDGATYPPEYVDAWGVDGVGDGYGADPVPTHLTEDPRTGALQRAPGGLSEVDIPEAEVEAAVEDLRTNRLFSRGFELPGRGRIPPGRGAE